MGKHVYNGNIDSLRAPQRLKKLEVERVVELSLEKLFVTKVLDVGTGSGVFAESFFYVILMLLELILIQICCMLLPGSYPG